MKCCKCKSWLGRKFLFTVVAFVLSGVMAFAQTKTVTGTIVDEFGEPIIGANVLVKGTTNGAVLGTGWHDDACTLLSVLGSGTS